MELQYAYMNTTVLKQQLQVFYSFTAVSFVKEFSLQDITAARKEKLYYSQWQLMGEFCEDDSEDDSHDRSCSCLVSDSIGKFEKKFQEVWEVFTNQLLEWETLGLIARSSMQELGTACHHSVSSHASDGPFACNLLNSILASYPSAHMQRGLYYSVCL